MIIYYQSFRGRIVSGGMMMMMMVMMMMMMVMMMVYELDVYMCSYVGRNRNNIKRDWGF